jgi:hypothetical protein
MSKKDFQLIADVLKAEAERVPMDDKMRHSEFACLRLAFHDKLQAACPNFNGDIFLRAAQPDPEAYNRRIEELRKL